MQILNIDRWPRNQWKKNTKNLIIKKKVKNIIGQFIKEETKRANKHIKIFQPHLKSGKCSKLKPHEINFINQKLIKILKLHNFKNWKYMGKCHRVYMLEWSGAAAILLFSTSTLYSNLAISCDVKDVHTHQIMPYALNTYSFYFSTILQWSLGGNFNSHLYIFLGVVSINVKGFCFVLPGYILPCEKYLEKKKPIPQALPLRKQLWHKLAWAWQHCLCWPPAVVLPFIRENQCSPRYWPFSSGIPRMGVFKLELCALHEVQDDNREQGHLC